MLPGELPQIVRRDLLPRVRRMELELQLELALGLVRGAQDVTSIWQPSLTLEGLPF